MEFSAHATVATESMLYLDEVLVALAPLIGHAGQMRIPLLAVAADYATIVELVLPQEALRVVVAVDVDLGQRVVSGCFLLSLVHTALQPRHEQLQPAAQHTPTHSLLGPHYHTL